MQDKNDLIMQIKELSNNSKKELLSFLQLLDLNSTSNTNGHFFLISDVPSNVIYNIQEKVKRLQSFDMRSDTVCEDQVNFELKSESDNRMSSIIDVNSNLPFQCDEKVLEILNATRLNNKKKTGSKYCMTLKKYNKPVLKDALKIDEFDLNEFQLEEYIL